jgi:predicted GIY-YIG superfamily endonuclease
MPPKAKAKAKVKTKAKAKAQSSAAVEDVEESEPEEVEEVESEPEADDESDEEDSTAAAAPLEAKRWDRGFNAKVQQACKGKVYVYMLGVSDPHVKFYVGIVYKGRHALWTRLRNHRRGQGGDTGDDRKPTREMLPVWLAAAIEVSMVEIARAYEASMHKIQKEKTIEKSAKILLAAAAKGLKDHPSSAVQLELHKEQNAKYNHAGGKSIHGAGKVRKYYPHYAARLLQRWFRINHWVNINYGPVKHYCEFHCDGSLRMLIDVRAKFVKLTLRMISAWKLEAVCVLHHLRYDPMLAKKWLKGRECEIDLATFESLRCSLPSFLDGTDR